MTGVDELALYDKDSFDMDERLGDDPPPIRRPPSDIEEVHKALLDIESRAQAWRMGPREDIATIAHLAAELLKHRIDTVGDQ